MSQKLARSMMALFHVPLLLIALQLLWTGGAAGHGLAMMPFVLASLGLAAYLILGDDTRDAYYPALLLLGVYDLVLYYFILR